MPPSHGGTELVLRRRDLFRSSGRFPGSFALVGRTLGQPAQERTLVFGRQDHGRVKEEPTVWRGPWQLDARHRATILTEGLKPVAFEQVERYAKKKVRPRRSSSRMASGVFARLPPDPNNVAKWKRSKSSPFVISSPQCSSSAARC
jgi:hypothetical protein